MGSCPVFKWARAVLSPQYLSLLPENIDRISLLTEVAANLKLTADVSSDMDSPALQGEWEDILRAQIKLLGLLSECQTNLDRNEKQDHSENICSSEADPENLTTNRVCNEDSNCTNIQLEVCLNNNTDKDSNLTADNCIEEVGIFPKDWKGNNSSDKFTIEMKNGDNLASTSDVRNVFVIANDYDQLNLLPSIARRVSSQNDTIITSGDSQNQPISTLVGSSPSQLIFVTGAVLESSDKTSAGENLEDELYMNIVLAPRKDNLKVSGESTKKGNTKEKENPLDKLCQLLRIDEEEVVDKRREELERRRRYENNLPFKYFCFHCSFKSKRESHYHKHLKVHEKHQVLHRCTKCQFSTIRVGMLRRHELHHHEGRLINCKHCPYKTVDMKLLSKHIQTRHASTTPHKCCNCGFKTGSLRELKNHEWVHYPAKSKKYWECNQCSYRTQNKGHLVRHKNDAHGMIRPFLCHHCGKSFKRHDTLKQHKTIHGEVSQTHSCLECNKICRSSAQLKNHMTVHSTQRPFLCELCGATFKTRAIQCRHVKRMHSNVSFQCYACKQTFGNKLTLMNHLKAHRPGDNAMVVEDNEKT